MQRQTVHSPGAPAHGAGRREYSLDLIRILATVFIMLCHWHQNFNGDYPLISWYNASFSMGNFVELFFMLSGLFSLSVLRKVQSGETFPQFLFARVRRLLPIVVLAAVADQALLLAHMILTGSLFSGRDLSVWGTVISALGINSVGVFFNQSVNNPTWYISVLMIYLESRI